MIPEILIKKYLIMPLEQAIEMYGENEGVRMFYKTFLIQTDHIPNKILEAQILNQPVDDYTEILEYRQFARDEINRLEQGVQ